MFKILTLNQISVKGLDRFPRERYEIASEIGTPHAILLRSYKLSPDEINPAVEAIARAGAGVNNIPVDFCTVRGIPVFNTPGANANAVKELVMAGLLLSSRGILGGINFSNGLGNIKDAKEMDQLVETEKKKFAGQELYGKTLGVVGLGAIGSLVAEMGLKLGMKVLGYDPALSVEAAWRLSSEVQRMENLPTLFSKSDYVTLHLPALETTKNLIDGNAINSFKPGLRLFNFARGELIDPLAIKEALEKGALGYYVSDFPQPALIGVKNTILMPHIGASTTEAEDNCAIMAADQLKDFLENGNIKNSVNYPNLYLERTHPHRIAFANKNVPKILSQVLAILANQNINVLDMLNKSRNDVAYNLIDTATPLSSEHIRILEEIEGVIKVRNLS